jgi:D-lyxose ketol-isomerase
MKRSRINRELKAAVRFLQKNKFHLPAWACWSPDQWAKAGAEADEIRDRKLGWDITDFGSGRYESRGLLLFTIRNGVFSRKRDPMLKDYCEKLLLVDEDQETPIHFHWNKMEDIINRGGGVLAIQLWNANRTTEKLDRRAAIEVSVDGIVKRVNAGGAIELAPGESITLPPYCYHRFYAVKGTGRVLGGEVSRVNDDSGDNRFLEPLPRFPAIEEDEAPLYPLCNEYPPAKDKSTPVRRQSKRRA